MSAAQNVTTQPKKVVKISVTLPALLEEQIENFYRDQVIKAAKKRNSIPSRAQIYSEIIQLGWAAKEARLEGKLFAQSKTV